MKTFITSDLHFSHSRIAQYCPKSRGHFKNVDEMNDAIINNINSVADSTDLLYILGDIGFCHPTETLRYLERIKCKKFIIFGNHDKKLVAHPDFNDAAVRHYCGVVGAEKYLDIVHQVDKSKLNICLFHFPIASWDREHHGAIMLHGHLHSDSSVPKSKRRIMDVGVDSNHMMPYDLDEVCREMLKRNEFKAHHGE